MSQGPVVDERPPVVAMLDDVTGVLDSLGDPTLWRLNDEQVVGSLETAYRLSTRLHALGVGLVHESDQRGLATRAGAASTQAWLRHRVGMRPQQAKRDVDLGKLIPPHPDAASAEAEGTRLGRVLTTGAVNLEQAGAISTALRELPRDTSVDVRVEIERRLVARAEVADPTELARYGHTVLEEVDPDAAEEELGRQLEKEEREAQRQRGGTRYADGHGNVYYKFRVDVEDDSRIWPVLDTLATPRPAADGVQDPRTARQRLADAFVEACTRVCLDGGLPDKGGDRPRALITMTLKDLRSGLGHGTLIDTGEHLSVSAVRRLACDAQIVPVVLGGLGQILDLGAGRRTFTGPVRTAVVARDRGCVHPGCDRPARWCDVHHVIPWWFGGETKLSNGVVLCGFHHRLYDDRIWKIRFAADGVPEAIPPPWVDIEQRAIRHTRFLTMPRAG